MWIPLKMKRKIISIACSFLLCLSLSSCIDKGNPELYGNWAVLEVFYKDKDLLRQNSSSSIRISTTMDIDDASKSILLPLNSKKKQYGYFTYFKKDDREWLEVTNSTDKRFDGVYLIHLEKEESFNKGKNQRYSLILESKYIYIYATKTLVGI